MTMSLDFHLQGKEVLFEEGEVRYMMSHDKYPSAYVSGLSYGSKLVINLERKSHTFK